MKLSGALVPICGILCIFLVSLVNAGVEKKLYLVSNQQWQPIYAELQDCLQRMGGCYDLAIPQDPLTPYAFELGYRTKAECRKNSMHYWNSNYPTVEVFTESVKTQSLEKPQKDLFLFRHTASSPLVIDDITALTVLPKFSFQGVLSCGSRQYVMAIAKKKPVPLKLPKIVSPLLGNNHPIYDAAFPVPFNLRVDSVDDLEMELEFGNPESCSKGIPKWDSSTASFIEARKCSDMPRTVSVRINLDGGGILPPTLPSMGSRGRSLQEHESHRRHLVEISGLKAAQVQGENTNELVLSDVSIGDIKELVKVLPSSDIGGDIVSIELLLANEEHGYDANVLLQSGKDRRDDTDLYSRDNRDLVPFWARGITGIGQVATVVDSGLETGSCFFADFEYDTSAPRVAGNTYDFPGHRKLVRYVAVADGIASTNETEMDHGTAVSSVLLGALPDGLVGNDPEDAIAFLDGQTGVAPGAKLVLVDIGLDGVGLVDEVSLDDLQKKPYEAGSRIINHSYGAPYFNRPGLGDGPLDLGSYGHQDVLHVVSAGNSGFHRGSHGSMASPAVGKNVLTVGASSPTDRFYEDFTNYFAEDEEVTCDLFSSSEPCQSALLYFSSNGPTYDGRIKPDIVGPGLAYGAVNHNFCSIAPVAGTSFSSPAVAGALILARQYLTDGFYPSGEANAADRFIPMGALLKAIAVNSATALTGSYEEGAEPDQLANDPVPNFEFGFGLVQLDNTLYLKDHKSFFLYMDGDMAKMPEAEPWRVTTYTFRVKGNLPTFRMRATLVYHDYPSLMGARDSLVADLDLEVRYAGEEEVIAYPNDRNTHDSTNNVEQVDVEIDATFNRVEVRVVGRSVPVGGQPYALVVTAGKKNSLALLDKKVDLLKYEETPGKPSMSYYRAWHATQCALFTSASTCTPISICAWSRKGNSKSPLGYCLPVPPEM